MDSKLTNIVFVAMIFLAGAFFISKGVLRRPPAPPPVVSNEPATLSQEVIDYIDNHCNVQKTTDAGLNAKITDLEKKIAELRVMSEQSKDVESKIREFQEKFNTIRAARQERGRKEGAAALQQLQDSMLDSCKPNSNKKSSISSDSTDSK